MNTEEHHGHPVNGEPFHPTVNFEPRDIDIGTIARYLLYLAITIVAALLICIPILKFLTSLAAANDTPMPAVRAEMSPQQLENQSLPPEPRLQGVPGHLNDPQQDLRNKTQADSEANESYGWVNKDQGIARIPVSEAMKIIAEKGSMPALPATEKKQ
jgi:hypothetical protein